MSLYITTAFTILAEVLLLDIMADTFLPGKEAVGAKRKAFGFMLAAAAFYGNVLLFNRILWLKLIIVILIAALYIAAFYRAKAVDVLGTITFYYSVMTSVDLVGILALLTISEYFESDVWYNGMIFTFKCAELGIGLLIRKNWKRENGNQVISKEIRRLMFFSGILIMMGSLMRTVLQINVPVPREIMILFIGIIFLSNFSLLYLLLAAKTELERRRLRDVAAQNQMQLEIYKNKQELYTKQGKRIHEHKNQLLTICHMLEQEQAPQAIDYIRSLTGSMTKELDRIYTNHPIADGILNVKKQEAMDRNISVNFLCSDLREIFLKEDEIIILLGNLLDNAIEASGQCTADRRVQASIIQEENQLVIAIKNTCTQPLRVENGRIVSTKTDGEAHGYGLMAVQDIVDKYDGSFVIKQTGDFMRAAVVIPVP